MTVRRERFVLACTRDWHTLDIARELAAAGCLECLFTTLPLNKAVSAGVPRSLVKHCRATQVLARTIHHVSPGTRPGPLASLAISRVFDAEVSLRLPTLRASHFWGWAAMCTRSLQVARRRGLGTLLSEGAPHIVDQQRFNMMWRQRYPDAECFPSWQLRQRQREYSQTDVIVVESAYARDSFRGKLPSHTRVLAFRPGVSHDILCHPVPARQPAFRALMVYPAYRKGAIDLLEAWRSARPTRGTLVLAGPASDGVRSLAAQDATVELHPPFLDRNAVFPQSSLFVIPTYWDGGPRALMEAAAYGLPLIASTHSIGPELIEHGRNGFLVEPGDVGLLAQYLSLLSEDVRRLSQMGEVSREIARRRLNWPSNTSTFLREL